MLQSEGTEHMMVYFPQETNKKQEWIQQEKEKKVQAKCLPIPKCYKI